MTTRQSILPIRESLIRSILASEPQGEKKTLLGTEGRSAAAVQASLDQGNNVKTDEFFWKVRCMADLEGKTPQQISDELHEKKEVINHILKYATRRHVDPWTWKPKNDS